MIKVNHICFIFSHAACGEWYQHEK